MNDPLRGCPRIEEISAFVDGALAHPDAAELKLHAAQCAICGATLQEFSELHTQLEPLRERSADVDIAALVIPQLARRPSVAPKPRRTPRARPRWASPWSFAPQALGGVAALGAGVYLGLALLAGGGAALRPAGMTAFDAEPAGTLCAGLPTCYARGR